MTTDETAARLGEVLDPVDQIWRTSPASLAIDPEALDRWREDARKNRGHDIASVNNNTLRRLIGTIDTLSGMNAALLAKRTDMKAEIARLRAASIGLRDDLLERAEWDDDAVKVVCAGNGAWRRFNDALEHEPKDNDNG